MASVTRALRFGERQLRRGGASERRNDRPPRTSCWPEETHVPLIGYVIELDGFTSGKLAARKVGRVFRLSRGLCINKRCARDKNHCAPPPRPQSFPPAPRTRRGIPIPCVTAIRRCRGGRFVGAVRNMLQMQPTLPHDQTIAVARWRRQWPPVVPTQAGEPSQ